jgi:hypothetical protein
MKNLYKVFGIIVLVAVIGFSFAACDNGSDDDGGGGGGGGSGSGGTFTITGIPAEYNGEYMHFHQTYYHHTVNGSNIYGGSKDGGVPVMGSPISNGSVSIPLWEQVGDFVRYSGNDTVTEVDVTILKYMNPYTSVNPTAHRRFNSVTFSNGNATRSWSQSSPW